MNRINYGILVRVCLEVVTVAISSHHTFKCICFLFSSVEVELCVHNPSRVVT